jgi:hypothetical protein
MKLVDGHEEVQTNPRVKTTFHAKKLKPGQLILLLLHMRFSKSC